MIYPEYGYTKKLDGVSFEEAVKRISDAMQTQHFGVISEIDVTNTLKTKLEIEFKKYKILGACQPKLAHTALSADPFVGLILPCNVIVFEEDDGSVVVSMANPKAMFQVIQNEAMQELVEEVDKKIQKVIKVL